MSATCFAFAACSAITGHVSIGRTAARLSSTEFQPAWVTNARCGTQPRTIFPSPPLDRPMAQRQAWPESTTPCRPCASVPNDNSVLFFIE
ncbi:Os06g0187400 [Oryza sativa Japonica Group]|uniref:Os06g0187400 protein n=1 Tax=Oryza sativa subsp. japonica TaxID=39947 RepID=A0A0P0WTY8_ORYSJ|nr:Os06g0187400 [Oryza sativa Japonica Group]